MSEFGHQGIHTADDEPDKEGGEEYVDKSPDGEQHLHIATSVSLHRPVLIVVIGPM